MYLATFDINIQCSNSLYFNFSWLTPPLLEHITVLKIKLASHRQVALFWKGVWKGGGLIKKILTSNKKRGGE